ncbi:MAG: hypothetical protein JSV62_01125, partial [Promethearchaeota archaeon]
MSVLVSERLQNINQLFIEGLYNKALNALDDFKQKKDLTVEERVFCNLIKSNIFFELGKSTDALKFAELACNMSKELDNKCLLIDSYISKAWALVILGDYDLVLQLISEGEELLKELMLIPQSEIAKRDALLKLIKSQICVYKSG